MGKTVVVGAGLLGFFFLMVMPRSNSLPIEDLFIESSDEWKERGLRSFFWWTRSL